MDSGLSDAVVIREFDGKALFAALDAKRRTEELSWPGAARAIWDMAPALNAARAARGLANHPISPATLHNLDKMGNTSCQHALFFLRGWTARRRAFWSAPTSTPVSRSRPAARAAARAGI